MAEVKADAKVSMAESERHGRSRWRKASFRIAAFAMPFVFLAALEVGLRLLGYGYPTSFFLKSPSANGQVLIENREFSRRYFPPGLARSPQPTVIPAIKPPNTWRIFVFGESAAMGDPEPAFGFARILEVLLRERYPGKRFEVVNVALTAINSHVVHQIAKDCAPLQGDVWVIYMGNNEVVGPFGAGTVFGTQTPGLAFIRASLGLKATRVGQLLDAIRYRLGGKSGAPTTWEGMEMFLNQQIRADDPRMAKVYEHFQRNLEDILRTGERAGARLLLSTVVSSQKDCPPFTSLHRVDLADALRADWDKFYQAGITNETGANHAAALAQYEQAARLDDRHAELQFRLGRCHLLAGNQAAARESFERARDLDALRFRADSRINQIIRQVGMARGARGIRLLDAEERFARSSPQGVTGEEFLYQHFHFNFDGNYLMARSLAEQITDLLPNLSPASATNATAWLSAEECARQLALTDWDRFQVADEMCKRLQQPPFTRQLDHEARMARWQKVRASLQAASRPEALDAAIQVYKSALTETPNDWVLHENLAKLLQSVSEYAAAEKAWRKVVELLPHYEQGYHSLANVLDAQGKSAEAISFFQLALRRRPDLVEARNGLGLALASKGRISEAIEQYEKALKRKPDFAEARVNLGQILAQQGRIDEAIAQYATALHLNSNSVGAHINFGKLLANRGKTGDAIAHYREAVRLAPENAVAHFNLGNALLSEGQADEALSHFAEAVRHKPDFAEARYNFSLQLAKAGRNSEALAQLQEVVRLQPDFTEAHFNLGVALAKERRFAEATQHFRETLRLQPNHPTAGKYLEQARTFGK